VASTCAVVSFLEVGTEEVREPFEREVGQHDLVLRLLQQVVGAGASLLASTENEHPHLFAS